jgi:cytochrome c oxidase subunit III
MNAVQPVSRHDYLDRVANNRLGLWLFIVSDSFLFGGLMVSRWVLWGNTRPELNQILGLIVTSILLFSSFSMNRAETAIAHGDRRQFVIFLTLTLFLGIGFLAGVVGVEWQNAPYAASTNVYGAVFFMMTGMHAFHVLTGVIILLFVLRLGVRGHFSVERHWPVEAAAIYWHFVDVVWIFYFPALYLMGVLTR